MIILKAKVKMSEDVIGLKEYELTNKLNDKVIIIPEELEVVTLNHVDEYIDFEYDDSEEDLEEVELEPDIKEPTVIELVNKALDELLANDKIPGRKCNG